MKIFVSSTSEDMKKHRKAVMDVLGRVKAQYSAMEFFGSRPDEAPSACFQEIAECDILVGIYAWRYGWQPSPDSPSITELEFDYATGQGKKCMCYVADESHPWPVRFVDRGIASERLERFKAKIDRLVRSKFTNPDNLAKQVAADLVRELTPPRPAMTERTNPHESEPELESAVPPPIGERIQFYEHTVLQFLNDRDEEEDWSDPLLIPLNAEVDLETPSASRASIAKDISRAISRANTTNTFLVVGDPGAGKSVSLRRLARKLGERVGLTGVVPIYVNLREWPSPSGPSEDELRGFVRDYLKTYFGAETRRFLSKYFSAMLKAGQWFLILDSFDEMPSVMGLQEGDQRIREVSRAFDKFLHNDARSCKSVLASRPFRQPIGFRARRLILRPFKESQVRSAMRAWLRGTPYDSASSLVARLFRQLPELVPAIRNPFTAHLIAKYINNHVGNLPESYVAIFKDRVDDKFTAEDLEYYFTRTGVTKAELFDGAVHIASTMFRSRDCGLEISAADLQSEFTNERLRAILEGLRLARLIRGGTSGRRIAFVHRRFAEYFAVQGLAEEEIDLEAISTDSQWRDALVVFCGVASKDAAQRIAEFCWNKIRESLDDVRWDSVQDGTEGIHCLRFLRDAFYARSPEYLSGFRGELSRRILLMVSGDDIVSAWLGAECISLMEENDRSEAIVGALQRNSRWISDTALRSCRHLASVGKKVSGTLRSYLTKIPTDEFLRSYGDLRFSFGLSDAMRWERLKLDCDLIGLLALWLLLATWLVVGLIASVSIVARIRELGMDRALLMWLVSPGVYLATTGIAIILEGALLLGGGRGFIGGKSLVGERHPFCAGLRMGCIAGSFLLIPRYAFKGLALGEVSSVLIEGLAGILIVIPWHLWPQIFRSSVKGIGIGLLHILGGALTVGLILLIFWIDEFLGIGKWLSGIELPSSVYAWSGIALAGGFVLIWAVVVCVFIGLFAIECGQKLTKLRREGDLRRKDKRILRDLDRQLMRERRTREWVVQYCKGLGSEEGRVRFLRLLRTTYRHFVFSQESKARFEGAWITDRVKEEIARLELHWNGIAEE